MELLKKLIDYENVLVNLLKDIKECKLLIAEKDNTLINNQNNNVLEKNEELNDVIKSKPKRSNKKPINKEDKQDKEKELKQEPKNPRAKKCKESTIKISTDNTTLEV
jgi:hypothetical protein